MKQIGRTLCTSVFLFVLLWVGLHNRAATAQAQDSPRDPGVNQADALLLNTAATVTKTPELHAIDILIPIHAELAVEHAISLTYKSKGIDPAANHLVIQTQTKDGVTAQISPDHWAQVSKNTFDLGEQFLGSAVEVTDLSATHPISWQGVADVWMVNPTNTGVTLVKPQQAITTEVRASTIISDPVAATTTVTFTVHATPKLAVHWGDRYPTQFTIHNGCAGASWPQKLQSREKFNLTVPTASITGYGDAQWDITHVDGSGIILMSSIISSPLCNNFPPFNPLSSPDLLFVPMLYKSR